jgi:hypothetical protein
MYKLLAAAALLAAGAAQAATSTVVVDALNDAYGATAGAASVSLTAGQAFSVDVAADDLWSAGALPRWSDANGLTHDLLATGSDDSGQAAGTLIGTNFGLYTTGDGSFAYGELVGQIGSGAFFAVGTDFDGVANATGTLHLFYWDSYTGDNSGSVTASVSVVPEPAPVALMLAGIGAVAGLARRRAKKNA